MGRLEVFAYILRRLGALVVILFGSSFLLYNLSAISTDPLGELRLSDAPNKEQLILNLTRELRLDLPPPLRYFIWLRGVLGIFAGRADFGLTREQEKEGSFSIRTRYLEVKAPLSKIPKQIDVDVSGLKAEQSIQLHDITLGEGIVVRTGKGQNLALASLVKL